LTGIVDRSKQRPIKRCDYRNIIGINPLPMEHCSIFECSVETDCCIWGNLCRLIDHFIRTVCRPPVGPGYQRVLGELPCARYSRCHPISCSGDRCIQRYQLTCLPRIVIKSPPSIVGIMIQWTKPTMWPRTCCGFLKSVYTLIRKVRGGASLLLSH